MKVVVMTGLKGGYPPSFPNALTSSLSIYNLPSRILLWSNQMNWKGSVRQYPANARIDTISITTNLIATSIAAASPQWS